MTLLSQPKHMAPKQAYQSQCQSNDGKTVVVYERSKASNEYSGQLTEQASRKTLQP
jgi:hypothetical protein